MDFPYQTTTTSGLPTTLVAMHGDNYVGVVLHKYKHMLYFWDKSGTVLAKDLSPAANNMQYLFSIPAPRAA